MDQDQSKTKAGEPHRQAPDQSQPQTDTAAKVALYALYGTLGGAAFSALTQIAVAWIQRH